MIPNTTLTETYQVPMIEPETSDRWDVEIEAESPRKAMQKAGDAPEVRIASSFVQNHLEGDDE